MKKKPAKTMNKGASITRATVLRKIQRVRAQRTQWHIHVRAERCLDEVAQFIKGHAARASQRPGGLGMK